MISLLSRTSSILLLILVFNLVACQAGRVRRAYDDEEEEALRKQRLLEKVQKDIEEDKREQRERRRDLLAADLFVSIIQLMIGTGIIALMLFAIYKCLKKNEQFYRQQGKG